MCGFLCGHSHIGRACAHNTFLSRACARASRWCKAPFNFWLLCIVFSLIECCEINSVPWVTSLLFFWCWVLVTMCRWNFSDNRCPLMDEVRRKRIAEIHQCFFYCVVVKESKSGTLRSDPLERKGTSISIFWETCGEQNIQLCTNEVGMPHARVM